MMIRRSYQQGTNEYRQAINNNIMIIVVIVLLVILIALISYRLVSIDEKIVVTDEVSNQFGSTLRPQIIRPEFSDNTSTLPILVNPLNQSVDSCHQQICIKIDIKAGSSAPGMATLSVMFTKTPSRPDPIQLPSVTPTAIYIPTSTAMPMPTSTHSPMVMPTSTHEPVTVPTEAPTHEIILVPTETPEPLFWDVEGQ